MERYRVSFANRTGDDLRDVALYIATRLSAPRAAAKKVKTIRETISRNLSFMPQKYRLIDNHYLASMGLRMMNVESRIAFFSIDEKTKTVIVRRIIHSRRDWLTILLEDEP